MLKDKLLLLPDLPGSYQMYDKNNTIIYIGKAKNLRKRVLSYFNHPQQGKTAKLVSEVADVKYIITSNEVEALILELNLIKSSMPKYNIMLTDDKSYPYIEYISKPYPRLKVSRYLMINKKEQKLLFGPYPNAFAARQIVNLINRLYPLKKCLNNPKEVCLYYHINECLGYCGKNIDQEKVYQMENEILNFLKGNDEIIINKINNKIKDQSINLNYEAAAALKKDLEYFKVLHDNQKVELSDLVNRDVIGYYYQDGYLSIQILFLRNGKIIGNHSQIFAVTTDYLDELDIYLTGFYSKHEIPKEIYISSDIHYEILSKIINSKFITPIKGRKYNLLKLANTNAEQKLNRDIEIKKRDESRSIIANDELKQVLQLNQLNRIEIFDNSNLFGDYAVSAMVVFINGQPAKKEYRKYKISINKNDDYNTMKEVIYRRYYRLLIEKKQLPELILVDGGVNQIHAAQDTINSLNISIPVYGLKKNDKHLTDNLVNYNNEIIPLAKGSNVFYYLTNIQDEVHRYTISFHRQIRSKGSVGSILDSIPGIGPSRRKLLLKKFGSMSQLKKCSLEELNQVLPKKLASELKTFLSNY